MSSVDGPPGHWKKRGQSSKDFVHKNTISLKEARESKYWLRLLPASYVSTGANKKHPKYPK
ncbi:MAG: four helix bundle protein [Chloracidobacterium sp.]|nr:four helix bundle protein [Chloracidobacterium sp.]